MVTKGDSYFFPEEDVNELKKYGFITKQKLREGDYGLTFIAEHNGMRPEINLKFNKFAVKYINISDCRRRAKTGISVKHMTLNIEHYKTLITRITHKNITHTELGFCLGSSAVTTVQRFEPAIHLPEYLCSIRQTCIIYDRLYIFKEFTNHGSLRDYLDRNQTVNENMTEILCRNMAEGIQYLHSNRVTHGNINCNNVLLFNDDSSGQMTTNRLVAKWTDFGLANIFRYNYYGILYDTNNYFKDIRDLRVNVFVVLFGVTQFSSEDKKLMANDLCSLMNNQVYMRDILKHNWFNN